MAKAPPDKFIKLLEYFSEQESRIGQGVHNKDQRPWLDFKEMGGEVSNFDKAGLHANFDRTQANEQYMAAKKDPEAKEEDIQIPKLAADFMAACERDFADMRKRSRIRMMTHAGVVQRLNGNSSEDGVDASQTPMRIDTTGLLTSIGNVDVAPNESTA